MEQETEVIPASQQLDMPGLAGLITGVLTPLAEQDAAVKQSAINADLEKHRLTVQFKGKSSERSFQLALGLLVITGGTLGGLMLAGKYDLAVNALWYLGGGLSGYGAAAARRADEKP